MSLIIKICGLSTAETLEAALAAGQRWALASDGIKAREGSALFAKHRPAPAQQLADTLVEHASRPHDDVAVLIIDVEAAS